MGKGSKIVAFIVLVAVGGILGPVGGEVGSGASQGKGRGSGVVLQKCTGRLIDTGENSVRVPREFVRGGGGGDALEFSLQRKELNCKKGRFKVIMPVDQKKQGKAGVAKVLETDTRAWRTTEFEDNTVRVVNRTGYLVVRGDYFSPQEYCFDQVDDAELSLFVCYPECYGQRPCVSKCCPQEEVWDVASNSCAGVDARVGVKAKNASSNDTQLHGVVWSPYLFSRSVDNCVKRVTSYHREQISVHYRVGLPSGCNSSEYLLVPLKKIHNHAMQRFRVLWTGGVIVRDKHGNWTELGTGKYCVDGMAGYASGGHSNGGAFTGDFNDQVIIACRDELTPPVLKKPIPLKYLVMLLVAAGILLLSGLISCLLWDKQNVYEWTVSMEVTSMFFLIVFLGVAHTIARRPEKSDFGSAHCVFIGAMSHFFWMSTFCWLFIINFEIWWNFRSMTQLHQSRRWFRFSMYQIVGWGMPFVTVVIGLLLDRTWGLQNEDLDCASVIPPNYGQLNCYVAKAAQGPYIFYPIGVILTFNLLFYLTTVYKMWSYQKKTSEIITHRSKAQTQAIYIFAKLFIVMGVSWIFEIVSWCVTPVDGERTPLYWVIFDIVTLFQAVSIFVIFTWKKEVLSRLWWKFPVFHGPLSCFVNLPGCGIIPNDRDRVASIHQHHLQQANKVSRDSYSATSLHHHQSVRGVSHQPESSNPSSPEQIAFSAI